MASSSAWHDWIDSQIWQLRAQDLLRTLKPLIPGHAPNEVRYCHGSPCMAFLHRCWQWLVLK